MATEYTIDDLVDRIGKVIGLEVATIEEIKKRFNEYKNVNKYKLLQANELVQELQDADEKLKEFKDNLNDKEKDKIEDQWKSFINNVTYLQINSLISKIDPVDCSDTINKLLIALNLKLKAVNEILQNKIKPAESLTGGDPYYQKYLKYKSKYLGLRRIKKF